jgi:hypothetical protein
VPSFGSLKIEAGGLGKHGDRRGIVSDLAGCISWRTGKLSTHGVVARGTEVGRRENRGKGWAVMGPASLRTNFRQPFGLMEGWTTMLSRYPFSC